MAQRQGWRTIRQAGTIVANVFFQQWSSITTDVSDMISQAEQLYDSLLSIKGMAHEGYRIIRYKRLYNFDMLFSSPLIVWAKCVSNYLKSSIPMMAFMNN